VRFAPERVVPGALVAGCYRGLAPDGLEKLLWYPG